MKQRLPALCLACVLTLSLSVPALAAEGELFPTVQTYSGFTDVKDGDWYAGAVKVCYETGIMNGKGAGFDPSGTMTRAEAAAIAARIHDVLNGGDGIIENPEDAEHWYTGAVTYMHRLANEAGYSVMQEDLGYPETAASRASFFDMLHLAATDELLTPINAITSLPDTDNGGILAFYNAGILTGVNAYGTFRANGTLSRAECAAMVARLVKPELRQSFTPAAADPGAPGFDFAGYATGFSADTVYVTSQDLEVPLGYYLDGVTAAASLLNEMCLEQGLSFAWTNTYGGMSFTDTVERQALYDAAKRAYQESGLAPKADPSGLAAWESENGMLKAKHILVKDEGIAHRIYAQLQADPDQFDLLLLQYGTDPGMADSPDGYVFGPGDMVAAFEEGVKALKPGEIGAPVQSEHGYHIIKCLPLTPDDYQQALDDQGFTDYLNVNALSLTDTFYPYDVDVEAIYDAYLTLQEQ